MISSWPGAQGSETFRKNFGLPVILGSPFSGFNPLFQPCYPSAGRDCGRAAGRDDTAWPPGYVPANSKTAAIIGRCLRVRSGQMGYDNDPKFSKEQPPGGDA
jgi:hypothetical protein